MNPVATVLAALSLAIILSACGSSTPSGPAAPVSTTTADEPPDKHDDSATFDVTCTPPSEVKIDGKSVGQSPITGYKVTPGAHDVTCVDEQTGPQTMSYTLEPGEGRGVVIGRVPSAVDDVPAGSSTPGKPGKKK